MEKNNLRKAIENELRNIGELNASFPFSTDENWAQELVQDVKEVTVNDECSAVSYKMSWDCDGQLATIEVQIEKGPDGTCRSEASFKPENKILTDDEDELETLAAIAEFFEEITETVAGNEIKKEKNKAR